MSLLGDTALKIKMVAAVAVCTAFVVMPTAAGAAQVSGVAGAYGEHVSTHALGEGGFSRQMNPGDHHGFLGFDEHH